MPNNTGYINTVAVMQKFSNLSVVIGVITYHILKTMKSMSVMIQDPPTTYKWVGKLPLKKNTYDYKTDPSEAMKNST